jgi:hypothetical protein
MFPVYYKFLKTVLLFFKKKKVPVGIMTFGQRREGSGSYTEAGKKFPECCPSLHRSEKELLERHSSVFHHKNTPG